MDEENTFKLILKSKDFFIPSNFCSFNDVRPEIYKELRESKEYRIKSNVSEKIFSNFINNWVYNENILLCYDNIFEYEQLSDEFDRIADLIQLFREQTPNPDIYSLLIKKEKLLKKYIEKKDDATKNAETYKKIISTIFDNSSTNAKFFRSKPNLYSSSLNGNVTLIESVLTSNSIEKNGLLYFLNEEAKTASIFRNISAKGHIVIPRTINIEMKGEFVITKISPFSFLLSNEIQSIEFSEDSELQSIEDNAFMSSSLESIRIPKSVTSIGMLVFSFCQRLKSIEFLPNSKLQKIGKSAFANSGIQNLSIPSSVSMLDDGWCNLTYFLRKINVFSNGQFENISLFNNEFILGKDDPKSDVFDILLFARRNVEIAKIPPFIKEIAPFAFQNCSRLKAIEFSKDSKLNIIGESSFSGATLESISIPSNVVKISKNAFYKCSNLKNITFKENSKLKAIDKSAFLYTSIEWIKIPSSVTCIKSKSFFKCLLLNKFAVKEKSNLKSIGKNAFENSMIKSISLPSSIEEFKDGWCKNLIWLDNIEIFSNGKENISLFDNNFIVRKSEQKSDIFDVILLSRRGIEVAVIPSFIKKIESNAFQNCEKLKTIEFQNGSQLESIGNEAFSNSAFEKIVIPDSVKCIGKFAFFRSKLKSIEFSIHSKLEILDEETFSLSSIESIVIPPSVKKIKKRVFSDCKNLRKVTFSEHSQLESIEKFAFFDSSIEFLSIPSSITEFQRGWCKGMSNLDKIELIDCQVNNVFCLNDELVVGKSDNNVFDEILLASKKIEKVTIPSYIKIIGPHSFQNCLELKTVNFNDDSQLNSICKNAFENTSIEKVDIPFNVCTIEKYAFASCKKLRSVKFAENSLLESIEKFAFANSSIERFDLPKSVKKICDGAFNLCNSMKSFLFPENSKLEVIGQFAFMESSIGCMLIPSSVKEIQNEAFSQCSNLQIIEISGNSKLKTINSKAFDTCDAIIMSSFPLI